ncbi:cbb3-type cytochrome c oxidase subunit 3 [Paracoccus sp. JM45]|uniref:cbb3-type cytochrome c oxidase subunit 3 n=1 Tax=Paracoccus sp. JM45 TaxID=2283626 RepID=UPI000E6C854E|nr:cbb3-type cytochrome c oxidase subunit 3 [Paracoccus sp. JM45]RJE79199.1 cbb3-type cytochrome c oxidase subunit 3 [Paracoccus sp. JM45]
MTDTYSIMRLFADSWMLLAMSAFFIGACLWAFRPGARAAHDEAANAIFRDSPQIRTDGDDQPKDPT